MACISHDDDDNESDDTTDQCHTTDQLLTTNAESLDNGKIQYNKHVVEISQRNGHVTVVRLTRCIRLRVSTLTLTRLRPSS